MPSSFNSIHSRTRLVSIAYKNENNRKPVGRAFSKQRALANQWSDSSIAKFPASEPFIQRVDWTFHFTFRSNIEGTSWWFRRWFQIRRFCTCTRSLGEGRPNLTFPKVIRETRGIWSNNRRSGRPSYRRNADRENWLFRQNAKTENGDNDKNNSRMICWGLMFDEMRWGEIHQRARTELETSLPTFNGGMVIPLRGKQWSTCSSEAVARLAWSPHFTRTTPTHFLKAPRTINSQKTYLRGCQTSFHVWEPPHTTLDSKILKSHVG